MDPLAGLLEGPQARGAADLLAEPEATIDGVAAQVGYSSGFALSTAFKRVRGISPSDHRRRVQAA